MYISISISISLSIVSSGGFLDGSLGFRATRSACLHVLYGDLTIISPTIYVYIYIYIYMYISLSLYIYIYIYIYIFTHILNIFV